MKNTLAVVLLCPVSLIFAAGQKASKTSSVEDQIKKYEQDWAQAVVSSSSAWLRGTI